MVKDMVSIIVPVYNVEGYIDRCLQSMAAQTYASLEIILVNDGSTDNSGAICERYCQTDPRFHYYCKENEGVSAARNYGMVHASGEYYMFVDSDDYIDPDMIEQMVRVSQKEQADIVQCFYRMEFRFGFFNRIAPSYQVLDQLQALRLLLKNTKVNNYPWGKLYRAKVFQDVEFPAKWRVFEDVCTVFKLFMNAETIVTMPQRFYHYVQRKGSFMNKNGVLAMDIDTLLMMRPAFEYQETMIRQAYPDAGITNAQNYFMTNMLVLYTMIVFIRRDKIHHYVLPYLDLSELLLPQRWLYRLCLGIARIKFGSRLRMQGPNERKAVAEEGDRLPQES